VKTASFLVDSDFLLQARATLGRALMSPALSREEPGLRTPVEEVAW
jgi:hypothetical protein